MHHSIHGLHCIHASYIPGGLAEAGLCLMSAASLSPKTLTLGAWLLYLISGGWDCESLFKSRSFHVECEKSFSLAVLDEGL